MSIVCCVTAFSYGSETNKFSSLLEEHWTNVEKEQVFFRRDPDVFRMNGVLPDFSDKGIARRKAFNQLMLEKMADIDSAQLSPADQVSYRLFRYERETEAKSYEQLDRYFPMNIYAGFHTYFSEAPAKMSFLSREDYDNYLISLADFNRYNQEFIKTLNIAVDKGLTHYCGSFQGYERTIGRSIVEDVTKSEFYQPVNRFPSSFSSTEKAHYEKEIKRLISDVIIPEYQHFFTFFTQTYMPNCRKNVGITQVPDGKEYYDYLIHFYTTTSMSAEDIHALGLSEVKRIKQEMQAIVKALQFKGTFREFLTSLRDDPENYASDPQDLLEKASYFAKRMEGELPKWFSRLPQGTYSIKASPGGGAYYVAGAGDGKTSGTYFVGANNYLSEPLYNLEALTYHEAVPGHHLQGTIAQELDVPEFRKTLYHSAYGEGWALYSESLGKEMGFYQSQTSDFGRLTYEMWRACRLVVDTGMHAFGWSRQQAVEYLLSNTALSERDVNREIDRYISWPGQALSYKIGELRIKALRQKAESELGTKFDIRAFHDVLVGQGSLPIAVLEDTVNEWIKKQL
ncbi:DUF885 domain-containing protein [Alteromonas sp. 5E99-2]|nr:DUF885 domain-containing protein [Alteromonas sp. 5E99-2]MBO1255886.1 DUF885 domain-containing protein [Alteromonas sp. 5E99-2]